MRKFKHPIDLKAAAAAASFVPVDVTLAELVQTHSLAKPRLELELRLRKWCDLVHGVGYESAWSISSERLMRNGVCVEVASQILGHRDQTMLLRRYGHSKHMSLLEAQKVHWESVSASTAQSTAH